MDKNRAKKTIADTVCRVHKSGGYAVLSNCFVRSVRIGCDAIGLLGKIMDLPPTWNFTIAGLVAICKDGETAVRSQLAELEQWGYAKKVLQKPNENPTGKFRYVYDFYEYSELDDSIPKYDIEMETFTADNATLNRVKKDSNFTMISGKLLRTTEIRNKLINSALLSAQNRKRCYWTNIPNVTQPDDLGIMLADVLENGMPWQDKSYCMTACYHPTLQSSLDKHRNSMVAIPIETVKGKSHTIPATYYKTGTNLFTNYGGEKSRQKLAVPVETAEDENGKKTVVAPIPINTFNNEGEKSRTFMAGYYKFGEQNILGDKGFKGGTTAVAVPIGAAQRGRYTDSDKTEQHIEVRNDGKSNCLTTVQKDTLVCAPVRVGQYGKGGQGQRIYSVIGKSVTLSANGGGQGAKTGLYKIDLPDGDYVIRKLTPIEAERLQTLPDNYTAGISNTQRYKCIGNAWTVDVISHILGGLRNG